MIFVGGQFKLELDAQFKSVEGGQYSRNLQLISSFHVKIYKLSIF